MFVPLMIAALGQAPVTDSLTLDAALELARRRRGLMMVARAGLDRARAEFRGAGSMPNPTASYSYTESVPKDHAVIEQPLDFLLRRSSDRSAARAGIASALADSALLSYDVEREARSAFYSVLATRRRLGLAQDEAAIADTLATLATRRLAEGEISRLNATQAALEAARARQLVSTSREEHAAALAVLARALALPADSLSPASGALDTGISQAVPPPLPIDSLPSVSQARADSLAAHARLTAAQRARIPFPALQAGIEWNDPTVPDRRAFAVFGLSLPLPLWHSGGSVSAAARADAVAAAGRLQETRAEARRQIATTLVRVQESALRALVARDSIMPLAVRQRELALVAFRAGETGIVPVLDALRAERQVARDLVDDLLTYQEAYADWLALLGERGVR
jgi:outer membrane protein, heavy metal efflux system